CLPTSTCGAGTVLQDGECLPASEALECGEGLVALEDGGCELTEGACVAPAQLDRATGTCVFPDAIQCGGGTEAVNGRCVLSCDGFFEIPNEQRDGCAPAARVQVVHASPDPALAAVDIYVGGGLLRDASEQPIGNDFAFGSTTAVLRVPVDGPFGVAPSGSTSAGDVTPGLSTPLTSGRRYLLVLAGSAGSGSEPELAVYTGLRESSSDVEDVELTLIHAAIDVPTLSVGRQTTYATVPITADDELFTELDYLTGGGGVGSEPDTRALRYEEAESVVSALDVYDANAAAGSALPFASIQTSVAGNALLEAGNTTRNAGVLVATGLTAAEGSEPDFQVIAVLPDGSGGVLDEAARLQFVHASIEIGSGVDVFLADGGASQPGQRLANNVAYQGATPFESYVAGAPRAIQLVRESVVSPVAFDVIASSEFTPGFGQTARLVAVGDPGDDSLTVNVVNGAEQAADPGTVVMPMIDIQMYHASTNAPASVDVYFSPLGAKNIDGTPEVSNLGFATEVPAITQEFSGYIVSLTMPGALADSESLVDFSVELADEFTLSEDGDSFFGVVVGNAGGVPTDLDLLIVSPSGEEDMNDGASL
ncbi:MAG: DUF4397 domain-containing protein, partial [Myxococcota bacterium]